MQAVAFHLWSRSYRHTFQADVAVDLKAKAASQERVKRLLSPEAHHAALHKNEQVKSACNTLGTVRTIEDFLQHCNLQHW